MKTWVILTRRAGAAAEDFKRLSEPEAMAVWQGLASGIVRAVHGLAEGAGAALEMESATLDEARHCVEALPYVEEKLLDVQYCPLKPFPGFEGLVAQDLARSPPPPVERHGRQCARDRRSSDVWVRRCPHERRNPRAARTGPGH